MTYLMDGKTFNELKWRAENGFYKAHTRRQEGYASGMLEVIRELEKNRIILEENIKSFGSYELRCKLGYEVSGTIHLLVVEG